MRTRRYGSALLAVQSSPLTACIAPLLRSPLFPSPSLQADPHAGYALLAKWGAHKAHGLFSVTSNIDGPPRDPTPRLCGCPLAAAGSSSAC